MNESSTKSEPTASRLNSLAETLESLRQLRTTVADLTARAAQVERDHTSRANRLRAQADQSLKAERERLEEAIKAARSSMDAEQQSTQVAFESRKLRIDQASAHARKRRLAEIDNDESRKTYEIQRGLLDAGATREADTQQNKTTFKSLTERLSDERNRLEQVEASARFVLGGYGSWVRLLSTPLGSGTLDVSAPEQQLAEELHSRISVAERAVARCRLFLLPLLFKMFPVWLWIVLILLSPFAFVPALWQLDFTALENPKVWGSVLGALAGVAVVYFLGRVLISRSAKTATRAIREAHLLHETCARKAEASFDHETERIAESYAGTTQRLNDQWKQTQQEATIEREQCTRKIEDRLQALNATNEARRQRQTEHIEQALTAETARLSEQSAHRQQEIESNLTESLSKQEAARESAWETLTTEWESGVLPVIELLQNAQERATALFPPWHAELWSDFRLPEEFPHITRFAEWEVDLEKLCGVSLKDSQFAMPDSTHLRVPLLLSVPRQASVLFETKQSGQEQVIGALNNLVLRLFTCAPPGRLAFTIFDPVGLGQNFAGIMHLADFEERLINSRIWTQTAQFEQRLADLNEHIEKVTQMYLRNEYETLAEYNAQAGRMAEKYHFLVVADFPANFSDIAVKRLMNIAASGARCGVHLLIHWDQRRPSPLEFVPEELRQNCVCLVPKDKGFALAEAVWNGTRLVLDAPPEPELATQILQQIGRDSIDSNRVEMPFVEVTPSADAIWSLDTTHELRVPIGRTGATKLQYLALGKGTRQHGLIAGKTGSGKSTLFHVIITNLSLWCSPEQVEFYLVDFKKGVEFKCYATRRLPHARVVAIESDREFGLSVLQRVDEELKRRGDWFRKLAAQDIAGYKRAGGSEPIPRTLLIIDEFQEFFVEDDRIAQSAALLLDRIVRQGRAFGIHVLLGSQTLGGAYTLARTTIGQMVVRIALQCNEADALLIMNEDNPAPRLLSRPGEAIYNDDAGALEGNSPFQVVWLPDDVRDSSLEEVQRHAGEHGVRRMEPIVFEGNAPADVRENVPLRSLLAAEAVKLASGVRLWLGAPNSIKGPTEAVLQRQSGHHLLIVGQREEAALSMLIIALLSLAAQQPKAAARFLVFDCSPPESPEARLIEHTIRVLPHDARLIKVGEVHELLTELIDEMERRTDPQTGTTAPANYLFVHGLQKNKKLRFDEDLSFSLDAETSNANPGLQFNKLLCEGAGLGFHAIATCDTYNNVMRFLSRKALSEFEMRVVFQMSANDSASLIDTQAANQLGLHRALFFNGHEGWLETFRPYALPEESWIEEVGRQLARLHS